MTHLLTQSQLPAAYRARAGVLTSLAALWLSACQPGPGAQTGEVVADNRHPVRVATVELSTASRDLRLPGIVRAAQRAEPAFLHAGYLAERFVARGDQVVAGQRLASLQNPALGPGLAVAEARVRELDERLLQFEADYQRARDLHAQGLASAEMLDRTLAQRNATREARAQALAGVTEARDQVADAVLRAPFTATVSDLLVEPGDFVQPGQPVMMLAGDAGLEVEVQLPEGLAGKLLPGAIVGVRAVGSGDRLEGRIREIGLARHGRPAPAIVALQEVDDWGPGISVHVDVTHAGAAALTVPLAAIVDPGTGQTRLFRIAGDRAELVPVRAGRLVGSRVEVSGALQAGDQVIVAGHQQLLADEAVKVLP